MVIKNLPAGLGINGRVLALLPAALLASILILDGKSAALHFPGAGAQIHEAARTGDVARLTALLARDVALVNLRDDRANDPASLRRPGRNASRRRSSCWPAGPILARPMTSSSRRCISPPPRATLPW